MCVESCVAARAFCVGCAREWVSRDGECSWIELLCCVIKCDYCRNITNSLSLTCFSMTTKPREQEGVRHIDLQGQTTDTYIYRAAGFWAVSLLSSASEQISRTREMGVSQTHYKKSSFYFGTNFWQALCPRAIGKLGKETTHSVTAGLNMDKDVPITWLGWKS